MQPEKRMLNKIADLSKRYLVLLAILITLLTGIRRGEWSTGFSGGTGMGFPWYFWRTVTWTDVFGHIGSADRQDALAFSIISLIGDILFWLLVLLISQFILKRVLQQLK